MSVGTLFFCYLKQSEPNSEVSADQEGGRGDRMSPAANAAARKEHTRTCTTGGFGSSPEVGYHKRYLHYCRYLIFFVNEINFEPNSEVSAWQVPRKGDTMSPSANAAARRECTGRARPEGSVQVRKLAFS